MVLALILPSQFTLFPYPPQWRGLDLNSSNSACARLGSGVAPPLGVVKEEVAVLIVLVRRHRRAVGAAVRLMRSRARSRRRRAQPRCAVCPQAFWMRCLYMPLVRLASSL